MPRATKAAAKAAKRSADKDAQAPKPSAAAVRKQIDGFIAKYTPEVEREARLARAALRKWMPAAVELVYDNYQFLVFGFGPSERAGEAVLSLALTPRWVTLCFLQGARLDDPAGLLRGSGSTVRSIRLLEGAAQLREPGVEALIGQALARAKVPIPQGGDGYTIVRSVSAKQRPRRPR